MGRNCCYPECKSSEWKLYGNNPNNIFFIPFPKPKRNHEKCLRWIELCCQPNKAKDFLSKISGQTVICSQHFIGGNGPTTLNPDPIAAYADQICQQSVTALGQVIPPIGWQVKRKVDGSCVFIKNRRGGAILQCTVQKDLEYSLLILNSPAEESELLTLPKLQSLEELNALLKRLNGLQICSGIYEEYLVQSFMNSSRIRKRGKLCTITKAVYSVNCKRITNSPRCSCCVVYRTTLKHGSSNTKPTSGKNLNSLEETAPVLGTCRKMPTVCAVATCKNRADHSTSISFHRFPKNKHLRKAWITQCKRKDENIKPEHDRVCSAHFNEDDFIRDLRSELLGLPIKRKLKDNAVPCFYENTESETDIVKRENLPQENDERPISTTTDPILTTTTISCANCTVLEYNNNALQHQVGQLVKSCQYLTEKNDYLTSEIAEKSKAIHMLTKVVKSCEYLTKKNESLTSQIVAKSKAIELLTKKRSTLLHMSRKKVPALLRNLKDLKQKQKLCQKKICSNFQKALTENRVQSIMNNEATLPGVTILKEDLKFYPGILSEVLSFMKANASCYNVNDRFCVLSFDEMKVSSEICLIDGEDRLYGPHEYVEVAIARSLTGNWKHPVFYEFDCNMSKEILFSLIKELESNGYPVVAMVCDLGGKNRSLLNTLEVDLCGKSYSTSFVNPQCPDRKVWCFADIPHMIKLLRNHFIDKGLTLHGESFGKAVIENILKNDSGEFKLCPELTEKHISLAFTEQQRVKPVVFSHTVAIAIKKLEPKRTKVSEFFECVNNFFDCMNSRKPIDTNELLCSFGVHEDKQMEAVLSMKENMEQLRVLGHKTLFPFQRGIIMSINSLLGLYEYFKSVGLGHILTSRLQQDETENLIYQITSSEHPDDHPSPVEFINRLKILLLGKQSAAIIPTHTNCDSSKLISSNVFKEGSSTAASEVISNTRTDIHDSVDGGCHPEEEPCTILPMAVDFENETSLASSNFSWNMTVEVTASEDVIVVDCCN